MFCLAWAAAQGYKSNDVWRIQSRLEIGSIYRIIYVGIHYYYYMIMIYQLEFQISFKMVYNHSTN